MMTIRGSVRKNLQVPGRPLFLAHHLASCLVRGYACALTESQMRRSASIAFRLGMGFRRISSLEMSTVLRLASGRTRQIDIPTEAQRPRWPKTGT